MKATTDRCLPFMLPYMGNLVEDKNASFHELRDESMHEKRLVVITTCGYVDEKPMYPALLKQLDLIAGEDTTPRYYVPRASCSSPIRQNASARATLPR